MTQDASTMRAPPNISATQYDDELVYQPGEPPAWQRIDDLVGRRANASGLSTQNHVFKPLTLMPYVAHPDTLEEVRHRVERLDRASLIERYQVAYFNGKRLIAGIMAAELIERGIPPCFWHERLALDDATLEQRADLVLADLAWMRRWYPNHAKSVRYQRCKAILTGSEAVFRSEAEFMFYKGRRPAWKLVGSMSMTERQQWDSAYLRSTPIKRHAAITNELSTRVYQALHDDLEATRRTTAFTDADAKASLERRHVIWLCARMVANKSPTEIAARYQQMTGVPITRQAAAKQLEKTLVVLRARGVDFTR